MSDQPDFLRDEYSPQGFVTDYIDRRIQAEGLTWWQRPDRAYDPEEAHHMLYDVCRIFEHKNGKSLQPVVQTLLSEDCGMRFTFNRYAEVVDCLHKNQDEGHVQMPYGRLVALVTYAGLVALELAQADSQTTIADIALYTARYLEKCIKLQWPETGRSWEGFVKMARNIKRVNAVREEKERRVAQRRKLMVGVAIAAMISIGVFAFRHYR
ncbi:hypothetical protein L596_017909 [Steinernema carpocapsae]|uniref:Apoptosis regulator Bcl-2 family BH4 domain-containing protein n=1 Tax=Steinernema carpocapsae TaxID=34508 RepID=A0A4U5N327_STECR|nr:hypothetical protein L596_017909 [Steinernema carpocapsae]